MKQAIHFGTGGWRAVIGDDFVKENIVKVAQGIYNLMQESGKTGKPVAIGYDRRFLSREAAEWVAEVLAGNGETVWFVNRSVPTPLVMFTVKDECFYYGIEITASHNPSCYNGIKLIVEEGRDASVECTTALEKKIAEVKTDSIPAIPFQKALAEGKIIYPKTPFNKFLDSIFSKLNTKIISDRGLRILFNPMHGSGTFALMTVLCTARCTVDLVDSNKDAYFGGSIPAPGAHELETFSKRVREEGYDLGIAVDGDGDRLGIIDTDGTYISANRILVMLYYYLHEYKGWKGPVVRNLATTHMLDKVAESFGEQCFEVPIGFKYISSKMDETDAVLGGESSGGLTVRGHINGKDSIYASSLFVEMMCAMEKTPGEIWSDLTKKYGAFEMSEGNFRFPAEEKPRIIQTLKARNFPDFPGKKILRVNEEDGTKLYFDDGSFVICRFSGTEPLLRIFAEDKTVEKAQQLVDIFRKAVL